MATPTPAPSHDHGAAADLHGEHGLLHDAGIYAFVAIAIASALFAFFRYQLPHLRTKRILRQAAAQELRNVPVQRVTTRK